MSQLWRGIAWRRAQALTLLALGTVVVAGSLVAASFSDLTDTPPGSVGVLLVLGVVALSVQAAASARSRRSEIALAQIRGRQGARLFVYFLAEPVTILLLATGLGILVGRWVTAWAADRWLDLPGGSAGAVGDLGWASVAVSATASLAAVAAGSWRTVREPLIQQLDASYRPRPAATVVLFGQTMVIVAAAIAAYQATQGAGSRDGWAGLANPALLSPILLGLAAGQVAAWGLRGVATLASRRSSDPRQIGRFLAVRRMARRSDTVFGARLVIAAAVVATVTASATTAVAGWQDESTRLALGGPRQFDVESGGLAAYEASHHADPDGRWLMAMVAAPDGSAHYRRMFADIDRWNGVVGDFLSGTAAADVGDHVDQLREGRTVTIARGSKLAVDFDNVALRDSRLVTLTVMYARPDGRVQSAVVRPHQPTVSTGTTTATTRLGGCAGGCTAIQLLVEGYPRGDERRTRLVISGIDFAGEQLLDVTSWVSQAANGGRFRTVRQHGGRLSALLIRTKFDTSGQTTLKPEEAAQPLSALATPGLEIEQTRTRQIGYAVDGSKHPIERVGSVAALPFVGRQGMLLDLSRALAGGGGTDAAASAYVVARADTPQSVIDDLVATGRVGSPRDFGPSLDRNQRRPQVQGVRIYTLMSIFAALIATVGLAAAVAGQRGERQHEAASLRVTGVRIRQIRSAHRREATWLSVSALLVVAVTGWLAARLTLEGLGLVPVTAYSPVLEADPDLTTVAVVALAAGALVGIVTLVLNRRVARNSPPSLLRDEAAG